MEFDDILLDVGDFGTYQLLVLCCFCLPMCFFSGIQSFIQLFLSTPPKDYWCRIPELAHLNKTFQLALGIPVRNDTSGESYELSHSKCRMYNLNYTDLLTPDSSFPNYTIPTIYCQNGWEFETEIETTTTSWDLVCSKDWYPTLALFIFSIGSVCGLMIFGVMSDYFGRKFAMFACLGIQVTFGTLSAFAPNFSLWCACRFFVGLTVPSSLRIPMIFAIELVRPEKRTRVGILTSGFYTVGTLLLVALAYLAPEWRKLSLAGILPEAVLLLTWWFMPESPRWLLAKNRSVEIKDFLRYTAKINGKILGSNTLNKLDLILDHENNKIAPSATVLDLFRSPNMRKKTLLITFIWFSNISVYMGLSYYSPSLGGSSVYLNYLLTMFMELPAYPTVWFLTEKLGRRLPLCLTMICGGMLCVITVALPESNPDGILAMYLLGKFFISASFFIICIYAGELYPTVVRGVGLGTSATIATMGVCLGPVIIHLGKNYVTLPLAVFGIFAILGAFMTLFLPETWHQKLPETLAEGESFGQEMTIMDFFKLSPVAPKENNRCPEKAAVAMVEKDIGLQLNVEKDEEEMVFDRHAHIRTFPQPLGKRPASRMNSSKYLMSEQEPPF